MAGEALKKRLGRVLMGEKSKEATKKLDPHTLYEVGGDVR
jgi:hypothetical protein